MRLFVNICGIWLLTRLKILPFIISIITLHYTMNKRSCLNSTSYINFRVHKQVKLDNICLLYNLSRIKTSVKCLHFVHKAYVIIVLVPRYLLPTLFEWWCQEAFWLICIACLEESRNCDFLFFVKSSWFSDKRVFPRSNQFIHKAIKWSRLF